jgi:hypothetical protein
VYIVYFKNVRYFSEIYYHAEYEGTTVSGAAHVALVLPLRGSTQYNQPGLGNQAVWDLGGVQRL